MQRQKNSLLFPLYLINLMINCDVFIMGKQFFFKFAIKNVTISNILMLSSSGDVATTKQVM